MSTTSHEQDEPLDPQDVSTYLFDYLLMLPTFGSEDELVLEYKGLLERAGVDVNHDNYRHYTTMRGIFSHFEHLPTGKHI